MFGTILVATDGSEDAMRGAEAAARIAEQNSSRVILLSVYTPPVISNLDYGSYSIDSRLICDLHASVLARTAAPFVKRRIDFEASQDTGNPTAVIVAVAEREKVDLIVVGSHGAGGLRRFLLGSTSDRITHYAPCSVLIVKREESK
jgi:nucleotide-binding universal stress UspA family protein